ncbi:hypothetical protein B0J11DRAFT_280331 [Dendryphion nanum]|uniref:Uncharacterized protein n=1 Tax=Dendryphion nanum TaxID=256645 RepID=A0A9P9DZW6_9PLEO|nr:hypothetical protein B0J11DRAFT_280331 [Dendryphion nanum]
MATQVPVDGPMGPAPNIQFLPGSSLPGSPPTRQNTISSIDSETYPSINPGFYKIPIHINCPRCHHRHNAVEFKVEVSKTKASYVHCEKCEEKMVAVGGPNATCTSLLSEMTTEPDHVELNARQAIFNMVRSMSSVGSPVLTSVPELPYSEALSQQSPGQDSRSRGEGYNPETGSGATRPSPNPPIRSRAQSTRSAANSSNRTAVSDGTQNKTFIERLKRMHKFKARFPMLHKFFSRGFRMSTRVSRRTATNHRETDAQPPILGAFAGPTLMNNNQSIIKSTKVEHKSVLEAQKIATDRNVRPEVAGIHPQTRGSRDDVIADARAQLSALKCRCRHHCTCHHPSSSLVPTDTDTEQAHTPLSQHSPIGGQDSRDFILIGSHVLDMYPLDEGNHPNYPLTISTESSTQLSQAATAINSESMTATSGPPNLSYLDVAHQPLRSRSPASELRQNILPGSRLRTSMNQDDTDSQSSSGSIITGGAVQSVHENITSHPDGYSTPPLAQTVVADSDQLGRDQASAIIDGNGPSTIPYMNGHRTPDDVSRP